jgi:feruloyl esterase
MLHRSTTRALPPPFRVFRWVARKGIAVQQAKMGLSELIRLRRHWGRMAAASMPDVASPQPQAAGSSPLREETGFGSNPGALRMLAYVPPGLPPGAPLVVALHGCTQTAAGYDLGCGWSTMAQQLGFALLMPEQTRNNNPNLCFNWFDPADTTRDSGEALSIRQMIGQMVQQHRLDPARIFVSGLSAGGGMTSVMLATYPELFAGGAILAGLPYGAANSVPEAFEAMYQAPVRSAAERGNAVRAASRHRGPWPRVSVWHGDADATVRPANAGETVKQWLNLWGMEEAAPALQRQDGSHSYRGWTDAAGRVVVESHSIAGMAHGVALHPGQGEGQTGVAGPYLLDVGVSSTHQILAFWGLAAPVAARGRLFEVDDGGQAREVPSFTAAAATAGAAEEEERPRRRWADPAAVIAKALAAAGLTKG